MHFVAYHWFIIEIVVESKSYKYLSIKYEKNSKNKIVLNR